MVGADVQAHLRLIAITGSNSGQLPVDIATGLVGWPYFLYLMRKKQERGEV